MNAEKRMRITRTHDSDHCCVRVICDDGSLSYPIVESHDDAPLTHAQCVAAVERYIAEGRAGTRIPDCPPKPEPRYA